MTWGDYSVSSELFESMSACDKALFAEPQSALFSSFLWYTIIARHAIPQKWHARCIVVRRGGLPQLALPVWCGQDGAIKGSLSSHYSVTYRPLFASGVKEREAAQAFARFCERDEVFRFDELDANDVGFAAMQRELEDARFWSLEFRHFGNWHQPIAGWSFSEYLANRPGILRSTIERKLKALHKRARVEWIRDGHDLERGIKLFHQVYKKSWKKKEPFFDIHGALIRAFASCGVLRLALLFVDDRVVAGQIWTVSGGVALLHKLAHDEAAGALSPGTALTALAIRSLMEDNMLSELDFGRGDDHYKKLWATERRQRVGVVFANSRYPRGWMQYGVSLLGKQKRRLWKQNAQEDVAA